MVHVAVHAANGTVTARASAATDADGCFVVKLPPQPHDQGIGVHPGATIRVATATPALSATATGVLFGTVVLCGGQSNMVHPVSYDYNATAQLAALQALPNLRLFQVGRQWAAAGEPVPRALNCTDNGHQAPNLTPGCDVRNQWRAPAAAAASFSAVCAFAVLETLRARPDSSTLNGTGAAVGLVEADWGGSNMHTWVDKDLLSSAGCRLAYPGPDASCPTANTDLSPTTVNAYGCLFRGMVAPLAPSLRPKFVLWYQGEANAGGPQWPAEATVGAGDSTPAFVCVFRALIDQWRGALQTPTLPFLFVQLAPWPTKPPVAADFAHVRVAQALVAATLPGTGIAITHDIGDFAGGVHPHNKTEVGRRLAYAVRRVVYSDPLPPPVAAVEAVMRTDPGTPAGMARAVVSWRPAKAGVGGGAGGVSLRWGPTQNCTICCDNSTMVVELCHGTAATCADNSTAGTWDGVVARIVARQNGAGDAIQFAAPTVAAGAVTNATSTVCRYAWSNAPQCVLFDQNDLPVGPFHLQIDA